MMTIERLAEILRGEEKRALAQAAVIAECPEELQLRRDCLERAEAMRQCRHILREWDKLRRLYYGDAQAGESAGAYGA